MDEILSGDELINIKATLLPLLALQLSLGAEVSKGLLPTLGIVNSLSSAVVIPGTNYSQFVHIPTMFAQDRGG